MYDIVHMNKTAIKTRMSYRLDQGLTASQLADKLGVSVSAVYHWEARICDPGDKVLFKLARLLKCKPSEYKL